MGLSEPVPEQQLLDPLPIAVASGRQMNVPNGDCWHRMLFLSACPIYTATADGQSDLRSARDYAARLVVRLPAARFCWLRFLSSLISPASTAKPAFSAA